MLSLNEYRRSVGVYLTNCRADNLSATTQDNYTRHLELYARFCEDSGAAPDDEASVLAWKVALHDAGKKNSTVAAYLRDVRLFFSWASASPLCAVDAQPVSDGMIPRVKKNAYDKLLTEDEIVSVLAGDKKPEYRRSHLWPRNNAMAVLFLESAVRVSELNAISLSDLDWDRGVIYIEHGKGDKSRFVTFPALAQKAVEDYLDSGLRPLDLPDDAPLFGTFAEDGRTWKRLERKSISDVINRHVRAVTGRDDVRAHALRHASASAMLTLDMPKEQIQALLGHSSVQTTERYIGRLRPEAAAVAGADMFSALERRVVRQVG